MGLFVPLGAFDLFCRIGIRCWQICDWRMRFVFVGFERRWIEGNLAGRETTFHLGHFGRADAEFARDGGRFVGREPREVFLHAPQVEEQLALSFGGGDLHQAPVAQHVLVDLGADPVHGE